MKRRLAACLLLTVVCSARADETPTDDAAKFVEDVQPLLEAKCLSCHGPEKPEGNLRLDSWAGVKAGGDRGAAIVPGDIEKSLLVTAISFRDPDFQMPPKQKLSDKEINTLTQWIKAGAAWPESISNPLGTESQASAFGDALTDKRNPIRKLFRGERLDLWSLKTPSRESVSDQPDRASGRLPTEPRNSEPGASARRLISIDSFIRERLAKENLKPAPEADRRTLIRRLTFDLIGLPPPTC